MYGTSFFFQAEDGIRDVAVTGVQTCALPIYGGCGTMGDLRPDRLARQARLHQHVVDIDDQRPAAAHARGAEWAGVTRSEERRVGKECSSAVTGWVEKPEIGCIDALLAWRFSS